MRKYQLARRAGGSSRETDTTIDSSVALPRETHRIQWHLRRRESSDQSNQPHPAPTGTVAQQSENFQRFYRYIRVTNLEACMLIPNRAVVSPTHVRVTAGGRIVPNTRAIPPPAFEWNKAKFAFEQPKSDNRLYQTSFPSLNSSGLQQNMSMASPSLVGPSE